MISEDVLKLYEEELTKENSGFDWKKSTELLLEEVRWLREWEELLRKKMERISRTCLDCVVHTEKKYRLLLDQGREDHERIVTLLAEADWLADRLVRIAFCAHDHCPNLRMSVGEDFEECVECWQTAAQKAVEKDDGVT